MNLINNSKVMITGCAGFIGSHLTDLFLENDWFVIGVDKETYAANPSQNLGEARKNTNFRYYKFDICDTESIQNLVEDYGVEWIVNCAAESSVDKSIHAGVDAFIHSNISGVASLLEVCRQEDVKLLHFSTDEVYLPCSKIDKVVRDETFPLQPQNPYSASKAAAEHLIWSYINTYKDDVRCVVVRPSNNFGPRQHDEKLVPTILKRISNGEKVPVYGSGEQERDWLYVKDCVRYVYEIIMLSDKKELYNQAYNITNCQTKRNIQVISYILNLLDKTPSENIEYVDDRPGHDWAYRISNTKLVLSVGRFVTFFDKAMRETIEFYSKKDESDMLYMPFNIGGC